VVVPTGSLAGLQTGDIVTAVNGQSLEWWAERQLTGNAPRPLWLSGETSESQRYTVIRRDQEIEITVPLTSYPWWAIFRANWGLLVFSFISLLVAGYLLVYQPHHPPVRALYVSATTVLSASIPWSFGIQITDFLDGRAFWLYWISAIIAYLLFWIGVLHFTLVFPRPITFMIGRWRVPTLYGIPYLLLFIHLLVTRANATTTLAWIATWEPVPSIYVLSLLLLILLAGIWQYRHNPEGVARQQIRWVVFGLLLSGGLTLILYILPVLLRLPNVNVNAVGLLALIFPLGVAAAVLRYRLFDIDVIIRRTLVYSILTTLLAMLYLGSVVVLQTLFTDWFRAGSNIAVVVSTLLIAALFTPLRHRVQDVLDRRFFRRRYDAQQVLSAFAAAIRNETDPYQLTTELVRVVSETVQPASITVWRIHAEERGSSGNYYPMRGSGGGR
jgi:hypothetical protein